MFCYVQGKLNSTLKQKFNVKCLYYENYNFGPQHFYTKLFSVGCPRSMDTEYYIILYSLLLVIRNR